MSNTDDQPPARAQPTSPVWHPGEDLWPLEEEMRGKAAGGELVDRWTGPFSPDDALAWDQKRSIRAAVLRHLLVADEWPVDERGVRLRGVRIIGHLDLEAVTLHSLSLDSCHLDSREAVRLDYATVPRLTLTRCQLTGLTGQMLSAREVNLADSTLIGLQLIDANVTGQLICTGMHLTGRALRGYALRADRIKVGGVVFLNNGFTADGPVRLAGADITGQLVCAGAQLNGWDAEGVALDADRMKVGGGVVFAQGFTAAGAVRLGAADITGQLVCTGAQLNGKDRNGYALHAEGIKLSGNVSLDQGFTAAGAVRMAGADITGQLNCAGAQLNGHDKDGIALHVVGMKCGGDVLLIQGFTAAGTIWLWSARVDGSVFLRPAALAGSGENALDAHQAQITGTLRWEPEGPVLGQVNLQGATAGQLEDNWSSGRPNGFWPTGGVLRLDGFTYGRFGGDPQATVDQRLDWIRSQYRKDYPAPFAPQPYEQLAAVYRQAGQNDQARKVAIARRRDPRKYGKLHWYRRFGNWFLDTTIRYGYQTWRAGAGLAILFVIFVWLSVLAQRNHLIVPVGNTQGLHFVPSATQCTSSYPCFYPVGYAIDTVIPIINVHQADSWGPDGSTSWGEAFVVATWIWTGLGWALATLLVAGYTGLVRQD